jgi:hypothetical protein
MAHYAFLDENNVVTNVIVGRNEDEVVDGISDWEAYYSQVTGQKCVRTSYNRNIRKHFAGIGLIYDEERDAFIAPQPYPSWILDEETCSWESPTKRPDDGNLYVWDEETCNWIVPILVEIKSNLIMKNTVQD